jgi:hypothetical protein
MAKDYNQVLLDKWYSQEQIDAMVWAVNSGQNANDVVQNYTPTTPRSSSSSSSSSSGGNYVYNESTGYYEQQTPSSSSSSSSTAEAIHIILHHDTMSHNLHLVVEVHNKQHRHRIHNSLNNKHKQQVVPLAMYNSKVWWNHYRKNTTIRLLITL